jgi:uncharacterized SAM-binding protein YcdF (DUF218 family)
MAESRVVIDAPGQSTSRGCAFGVFSASSNEYKTKNLIATRFAATGATAISATATHSQKSTRIMRQRGAAHRLRRYLVFALLLTALGTGAWLERVALLRGAADFWVVSDPISPADAVVVLGGGIDDRTFVAADLYAKGLVHKILLSRVEERRSVNIGAVEGHTELNLRVLRKLGVPDGAIELFGNGNKNTRDEAVALKSWTERHAASAFIVPAEAFFARRVRWIFQREFSGTAVRIEVPSFDPPSGYGYSRAEWWKTEQGVITFQNEVLKYFYYRLKYMPSISEREN